VRSAISPPPIIGQGKKTVPIYSSSLAAAHVLLIIVVSICHYC